MTERISTERIFAWTPAPLGGLPTGVLVLVDHGSTMPGCLHLGEQLGHHLFHIPAADPATTALDTLPKSGIAAAVTHDGGDERRAWLPLRFALHLAEHRAADPIPVTPCVTGSVRPGTLPAGTVRIPHLVAVTDPEGNLVDRVIWEIMTQARANAWLGGRLPDQEWFEARLPQLLGLRGHIRRGQMSGSDAGHELEKLLDHRYLSIRFAYRHAGLLADALSTLVGEHTT
ncbi:MAG: hypothetical protein ACRDZ4_23125 [Egibacteraceae bacterium]